MNKIPFSTINCKAIHCVLKQIEQINQPILIWGGAVRDTLFGIHSLDRRNVNVKINDIDLAVLLPQGIPVKRLSYRDTDSYEVAPLIKQILTPLCNVWNVKFSDFFNSATGSVIYQYGMRIDIMGLRAVSDSQTGEVYPDVFALENYTTFSAVPMALSINQFALDPQYRLYGPLEYIDDFEQGIARFINPPVMEPFTLLLILRLIDYLKRFHLKLEAKSKKHLREHVAELQHNQDIVVQATDSLHTQNLHWMMFAEDIQKIPPAQIIARVLDELKSVNALD